MTGPRVNPFAPQRKNPFAPSGELLADDSADIPQEDINKPGFFEQLGNTWSYIKHVLTDTSPDDFTQAQYQGQRKKIFETISNIGGDVSKFADQLPISGDPASILNSGLSKQISNVLSKPGIGSAVASGLNPVNIIKSMPEYLEIPISVLSGTKNVNGEAVPTSPQEQAANIEKLGGMVAQMFVAGKVTKALSSVIEGEQALGYVQKSTIGKVMANVVPQTIGQSSGGAVYGLASGLQDDTEVSKSLNAALTFAPIGVLSGLWKTKSVGREANIETARYLNEDVPKAAGEVAALRSLQTTGQSSIKDVLSNVDALANSDNAVQAAIKSSLDLGKGVVVEGLSPESIKQVTDHFSPSDRVTSGNYLPDASIQKILNRTKKTNIGGMVPTGVEFADVFDQASYYARGNSKNAGKIMQDIVDQTGLTQQEVISHGNAVRENIREQAGKNAFQPRSQIEIDQLNNEIIQKGEARLLVAVDGKQFSDATGKPWTKVSDYITDGQQTLDVKSNLAKQIAGRDAKAVDPLARVVKVSKQNFQPTAGRSTFKYYTYEGANGNVVISPEKYNSITTDFFKKTGFMPNELVTDPYGYDYIVRAGSNKFEKLSDGSTVDIEKFAPDVRRSSNGLQSEFYKNSSGDKIARAGLLNGENYFNKLYEDFKKDFSLETGGTSSYQDAIVNFAKKSGIDNPGDVFGLQKAFYNKLSEEAKSTMPQDELDGITKLQVNLNKWLKEDNVLLGRKLSQQALSNGMYITADGGGSYSVKDLNSSRTMHQFSEAQDGLDFITKSKQSNGLSLDGGDSNVIPPTSANAGHRTDPYSIYYPDQAKFFNAAWLDNVNNGKYASALVPIGNQAASADAILKTEFAPKVYQALQKAQNYQKNFINGPGKELYEHVNKIQAFANKEGINDPHRLGLIADYVETMDQKEIMSKLLSRKMTSMEVVKAANLTSLDVDGIVNYMYKVKQEAGDVGYKTPEFALAKKKVASSIVKDAGGNIVPMHDGDVVKAGDKLFDDVTKYSLNDYSPYAILRLAKAVKNPSLNLTRADFAAKMDLKPSEIKLGSMLDEFYQKAGNTFKIPPEAQIAGYLPHAKIAVATGYNPWNNSGVNPQFARELTRIGLTPDNALERNPIQLTRNYLMSGVRTAKVLANGSSFLDMIKQSQEYVDKVQNDMLDPTKPGFDKTKADNLKPFINLINEHIADVNGVPDLSTQLGNATKRIASDMLGGDVVKGGLLLTHASLLGGRLGLTARDVVNAMTNSYMHYGAKFTKDAFISSFSKEYMQDLVKKGVMSEQSAMDLLMPGENINDGLSRLTRIGNATMKWNGQQLVHMQTSAGIYKATYEHVAKESEALVKNEATKKEAYTRLKIQALEPVYQKQFDDLISSGKTEQAADMLGKYRVKQIVNVYGQNNNPIAWNTAAGRLLGQFGSWGANEAQTVASALIRGTPAQRIQAGLRLGVANGVIAGAGYYTGLNLYRWMITPFGLFGVGPLVQNAMDAQDNIEQTMSTSPYQQNQAWTQIKSWVPHDEKSLGHMWIPYSYMMQDFVTGYNMMQNDFGPASVGRAVGLPVNKEVQSPFQQQAGYNPRSLTDGGLLPRQ